MFDCDDYFTSESDESLPPSPIYDRYQSVDGYHDVPPPYTGTFMPPKPDLVFHDAPNVNETAHIAFNVKLSPTKPDNDLSHTHRPLAPNIEDWVFDSEDDSEPNIPQNFPKLNGGYVAFGGNPKGGKIFGKCKIKTGKLNFDDVYFAKELKFNLFSVSKMCDKKNSVLFTDTECLVRSPEFKLPDENQVLLRVPRENNMYNAYLKNIVPSRGSLGCFFATKDETSPILKTFIIGIENQLSLKVKIIKSDNGTELKNNDLNQFCGMKGINREFSVPRTPQQNGIAERKNRTLIEAARTMMAGSLLPIPFWAEVVNTICYVQNQVLVTKPQNKTPYELLLGNIASIGFMRPFGCPVTILNTLDPLGKFDGKVDEGFLIRYSVSSKTFRVFNSRTRIVQETLHIDFLENKPNVAGVQEQFDVEKAGEENIQQYVLFPVWSSVSTNPQNTDGDAAFEVNKPEFEGRKPQYEVNVSLSSSAQSKRHDDKTKREAKGKRPVVSLTGYRNLKLEDITYFDDAYDVGAEADFNNLETSITVSPIPITRVQKDHHVTQIIGDLSLATQTRRMTRVAKDQSRLSQINNDDFHTCIFACFLSQEEPKKINNDDFHTCIFACFLSQEEPKRVDQALKDPSWIEAMQEVLLQFKMQKVWVLVDLPHRKRAIDLCKAFEKLMKDKFQLSSIEELTFFLGLQVKQKKDGIFISQDKYVAEIIRKFGLTDRKSASTPIDTEKHLLKDPDGFNQIIDFLNGSSIKYALIVNPNIYVSCIKQFWTSVLVKKVNDVTRLQALVDKKKVIITEATIRDALRLDDAEGIDCLPNEEIFIELARMGYEKPFTKLPFYKAFFSSMLVTQQVDESTAELNDNDVPTGGVADEGAAEVNVDVVPTAIDEPSIPSPTPSTQPPPLSQDIPSTSQVKKRVKKLERRNKLKVSKLRRLKRVGTSQKVETSDDTVMNDVSKQRRMIADMDVDVDVTLKDIAKDVVVDAKIKDIIRDPKEAVTPSTIIHTEAKSKDKVKGILVEEPKPLKKQAQFEHDEAYARELAAELNKNIDWDEVIDHVQRKEKEDNVVKRGGKQNLKLKSVKLTLNMLISAARRRKGVVIRDLKETAASSTIIHSEAKSKDKGKGILVEVPKPLKKQAQIKQDEDEAYARELEAELNNNIDWDEVIDHVQRKEKEDNVVKRYQALKRKPQTKAQARKNMMIYLRNTKEQIDEEDSRTLKRLSETQEEKVAKKQKLDEKVAELKRHL
nr:putative ribonuclease H-like domain-containing protein [Tanacetum cinerariifolium]